MRRDMQGHVAEHEGDAGGVDTWQEATRTPVRGATWKGAGSYGAHGLVGPSYRIGAVTQ